MPKVSLSYFAGALGVASAGRTTVQGVDMRQFEIQRDNSGSTVRPLVVWVTNRRAVGGPWPCGCNMLLRLDDPHLKKARKYFGLPPNEFNRRYVCIHQGRFLE